MVLYIGGVGTMLILYIGDLGGVGAMVVLYIGSIGVGTMLVQWR